MKGKKIATLLSALMLGLNVVLPIPAALASETEPNLINQLKEETNDLSYKLITYDGMEQTISFKKNIELKLLGWKTDLKEVVLAELTVLDAEGNPISKEIELKLKDQEVTEYEVEVDQKIRFQIEEGTIFETKETTPFITLEDYIEVEKNENETSKEEAVILDDQGIILQRKDQFQFVKIENDERAIITEEEYISLNEVSEEIETEENPEELEEEIEKEEDPEEVEEETETEESTEEETEESTEQETEEEANVQEEVEEEATEVPEAEEDSEVAESIETITEAPAEKEMQAETYKLTPAIPNVVYSTHIEKYGWSLDSKNGETSGTQDEAKRLESIKIKIDGIKDLGVAYSTHVEKLGWTNFVSNGQLSGTEGQAKRLEAIKIQLTGKQAEQFDIYYRVHAQKYGWLGWTKNGEPSGTEGQAKRLEAIEMIIVEKGSTAPGNTNNSFINNSSRPVAPSKDATISYSSYIQGSGWQSPVTNGSMSGTQGVKKSMEAIRIGVENISGLNVRYSTHMQSHGWMNWVNGAGVSGLPGQNKRLEAVKIELTGVNAKKYDIYYRLHVERFGWLGWAKNGESAGSEGYGFQSEAMEIKVVPQGSSFERGGKAFQTKDKASVIYTTHIERKGWLPESTNGGVSGTQGQALRMEALKISLKNDQYSGGVSYKTHVEKIGWMNEVSNGSISGTTGEAKRVEGLQLKLTGEMSQHYDIYYRTYTQTYGWLGWAKNGMSSGTEGMGKRVEGIQVKLIEKGLPPIAVSESTAFKKAKPAQKKKVIFLDAGHGGSETGTSYGGVKEKDLNLQISFKVKSDLEKAGYVVIMSRTTDVFVDHIVKRSEMANASGADIFISLHHNAMPYNSTVTGIETFYYEYDPNWKPAINGALHNDPNRLKQSANLAHSVQNSLISATGAVDRKVQRETFAVLRETALPAILVEFGFMSSPEELKRLQSEAYQNTLSKALTNGVNTYFKNK